MMDYIKVKIEEWCNSGALLPHYDNESNILEVTSNLEQEWKFGIDIDGKIVFDMNKSLVLANFDLLISKRLWLQKENLKRPVPKRKGVLKIDGNMLKIKSFNIPLTVQTNEDYSVVQISIECGYDQFETIEMSKKCVAQVNNNILCGFFINL